VAPDGIGACFLDVGSKQAGGVLKFKFRARVFDAENAGRRDDRDDGDRDDHLRDGEPALLRRGSVVGFHLRDYLRAGPVLVQLWQAPFRRGLRGNSANW